ncbi:MAG: penicillin-binding protein, partial [Clostridioides sp.]|nr:penicillin-binding protein [Clostridioides sp.]
MTTIKYQHYTDVASNKTFKKLVINAPRGEIRDRYGRLIAGNINQFVAQVSGNDLTKNGNEEANETSLKLINLLEKNGEKYVDEFPIYFENGKYYYTFDKNIRDYKKENDVPLDYGAKKTFYFLVDKMIEEGVFEESDRDLEAVKLQKKLNENGYYPPILVSTWQFTDTKNKKDWLASYKIKEENPTAKEAFNLIRNSKSLEISSKLSDEDARKILVVRNLVKSQGYTQYNPVSIAKNINETTISQIEENAINFCGVSIATEPVRYYPDEELASHILGYVGKIPSSQEETYLENGYSKNDMIGLAGIEKSFESQLKGNDGYRLVQVDALGKISQEIESAKPESGDTVYLTIDKDVQKVADDALKNVVEVASKGGTFQSKFGNMSIGTYAGAAKSAALIAIDVESGEVIASSSYPNYDPNLFATGISSKDYKNLQPENKNDLLAASPLLNLVTQGAFQPGSTFKLITAMAALENGLDPNYTINDTGVIRLGTQTFADYTWNHGGGNHGLTNLYKAIQESCNVYFYTIGSGKNWIGGANPGIDMNANKILQVAKLFGLDTSTGLGKQIEERIGRVPDSESKLKNTKLLLESDLTRRMSEDFQDITKKDNEEEYNKRIKQIVAWADEEKTPGRVEAINRLKKLNVKSDKVESYADLIVYSYLNFSKWGTADTFNLAIGQGENAYTPAQMARAIASIANGGNLIDLSVVNKTISSDYSSSTVVPTKSEEIDFKYPENLKEIIKGMKRVALEGSGKKVYANFPISVAAKTGTAEKSGKVPTENEYEYLKSHITSYGVTLADAEKLSDSMKKKREEELTEQKIKEIQAKLKDKEVSKEEKETLQEQLDDGVKVKLENTDKINATYLRKAIKELNQSITDDQIDRFKSDYGSFAWSVQFAPAD